MPDSTLRKFSRGQGIWIGPRVACLALLLTSLIFLTGCPGKGKGPKNSVSGKVTLGNQTVAGSVVFVYADGKEVGSPINAQGVYTIPDPPPGQVKVLVKPVGGGAGPALKPPPGGPEMPKLPGAGEGATPPAKYAAARTSDLTYEVKSGNHTFDIPLKP